MVAQDVLKRAVAACLVAVTGGCVMHLPPPDVQVQQKDVHFLEPGRTTRDELRQKLGAPNIVDGSRISVYEWRTARGVAMASLIFGPYGSINSTGSNQSRLLVEFDQDGKLRHVAFAEFRFPGVYFKEPPGSYFVDGTVRELPRPAAALLKPSRSLAGRDSRQPGQWLWHPVHSQTAVIAVSADGRYVAAAPVMGNIELWDISTGGKRVYASGFKSSAGSIDVSRDGKTLAAAGFEDVTVLWNIASGERLHVLRGHGTSKLFSPAGPLTVALAPDGVIVATADREGLIKLWDVASGKETASFKVAGAVLSLAFAPHGSLLAAATSRGDVVVVDVVAGKQGGILPGSDALEAQWRAIDEEPSLAGRAVAFSQSGEMLAASDCVAVQIWRVSDIQEQLKLLAAGDRTTAIQDPTFAFLLPYGKQPGCPTREPRRIAFSPDDELLIASSNLYSVWDLRSRRLLAAWEPSRQNHEPADLTLGPGTALLAWNHAESRSIQVIDLAPIIRELNKVRLQPAR